MIRKKILLIVLILNVFLLNAQDLKLPNSGYLRKETKSIDVDSNYTNGNWNPLLEKVKNKRIVLLGEQNHGSKEIFISRNDLIKSLHEKLDFNVIIFESGIGELASIEIQKNTLTPTQMTYGFFSGWRTKEFTDLMKYVKFNNISISGFDVQKTGSSFENLLISTLKKLKLNLDQYPDLEKRFDNEKRKLTNRKAVFDSVQNSTLTLINDFKSQLSIIEKSDSQKFDNSTHFVTRTLKNRIKYLEYFLEFVQDQDWNKRWEARDYMMYSNIDWLLKTVYKNQKVIVIAHNFHISKFNEKLEVMGEFLNQEYNSEIYTLGIFAGTGTFYNNRGQEENLTPASDITLDIKHIINLLQNRVNFLDISSMGNEKSSWLFNEIIVNDTFIDLSNSNKLVLSKNFDGLLFIDEISVPEKN
ncbi:erythromycin esterase family protein [Hanstruepera ponticola]|uniref:erythromycin esterase family protein n=1 Tax=Hanstruepera ponticola TaxID=2042995 RepID=UPI000CF0668D|nr:erythromycin esterase family protein [Hanstruepera ponticola]